MGDTFEMARLKGMKQPEEALSKMTEQICTGGVGTVRCAEDVGGVVWCSVVLWWFSGLVV